MYHFVGKGCLVTKNDHKRLLADINYKKILLELKEMLGRRRSDRRQVNIYMPVTDKKDCYQLLDTLRTGKPAYTEEKTPMDLAPVNLRRTLQKHREEMQIIPVDR
ncbi:hypothetical protein DPMN_145088 [Dreissena polymorpha]|uniref:Uncharacterized protein n=1 Tax=Dreissena polymorpha TaxID=45954 RepID=A0A9D4IYH1_DREPO|nr:hypothetical protein DPMN_145088 [Dreissena polymorpha]